MINSSEKPNCRICFSSTGKLITPCYCRGVFAFVHHDCLAYWLEETNSENCDICRFKYKTIKYPKNFLDWIIKQSQERDDYISSIGIYLFLLYFLTFGSTVWYYSLGRANISLNLLLFLVTLILGILFTISLCSFISEESFLYNEWVKKNFRVKVLDNPNSQLEPPTPPRKVARTSGITKGSPELNYQSSSSSEGF